MLNLTLKQRTSNAEYLGIAFSHLRAAGVLIDGEEYAQSLGRLYFAGFFGAKAALSGFGMSSNNHSTWTGKFNREFGMGQGWVPRRYVSQLRELSELRRDLDYQCAVPNNPAVAAKYFKSMSLFLKKVRSVSPTAGYGEFVVNWLSEMEGVEAIEWDYYCPKSYLHKERVQFQVKAEGFDLNSLRKIELAGAAAISKIRASRDSEYVLGWNNRLGQSGDSYLLFLDLDHVDLGTVKSALRRRKGWLFESGNGYHFIGSQVLGGRSAWENELQKVNQSTQQLLDPLYVEFSIRRGYSTLRATKSKIKEFIPFLCWENL
jgi:uncharacterized protein (UPF0332 family)